jgi:predicted dehydrogenase
LKCRRAKIEGRRTKVESRSLSHSQTLAFPCAHTPIRQNGPMPVRVGFLSVAHMHAWGYAHGLKVNPRATVAGVWDEDAVRAESFAKANGIPDFKNAGALCETSDAVIITSENKNHAAHAEIAASSGKHILCEKPLVTSEKEADRMFSAVRKAGVKLFTAFPCRFSPAFWRLQARVDAGDIGKVSAICATNRGRCPFDWFVDVSRSGGGSMIDHVVHVADLLWVLLKEEPVRVQAQTGNNMHAQSWEDTAMLTLEYPSGVFATLDSSWSRPKSYKTWGDVTMNVVGDKGVIEMDMFNQQIEQYTDKDMRHNVAGFGSDLDAGLIEAFLNEVEGVAHPDRIGVRIATGEDGWRAARVALAGYENSRTGHPIELSDSVKVGL